VKSRKDVLSVALKWSALQTDEQGRQQLHILEPEEYDIADHPLIALVTRFGMQKEVVRRLDSRDERQGIRRSDPKTIPCVFVTANGLEPLQIGQLWDAVTLTDLEEDILASLHIIAPEVERITLVGEPIARRDQFRTPIVRVKDSDVPIPLRSMGEGMNRLFGIALALVNAKDGMLLVDEVESGLHYSALPDMWQLIFRIASRLNVQVFATTHSWDCIEAFQKAAMEDQQEEGLLIRLHEQNGTTIPTLFDERKLGIATRDDIEVR
jgi:hypothetical protein